MWLDQPGCFADRTIVNGATRTQLSRNGRIGVSEPLRIGQVLIEQGILNDQQVFEILEQQRSQGIPFGVLAQRMFDVTVGSIEHAWADQYHRMTGTIDLSQQAVDDRVLGLVSRRQAWQFEMMPLHVMPDGGELVVAATGRRLARAVTFAANRLEPIVYFRVAEPDQLRHYLQKYYPMPEVTQDMMDRARLMSWQPPESGAA